MDEVLALRPFLPAKDFTVSKSYYQALGFALTHEDDSIALLKTGSFSFILQNYYQKDFAENCMVQMLVRNAESWWQDKAPASIAERFALRAPTPPAMQSWGLKVGFLFDPSGVLWHIAEVPF